MPAPNPALLHSLRAQLHALAPRARYGVLPFGDARVDGCFAEGGLALGASPETVRSSGLSHSPNG
jgi:hypothetical protein